MAWIESHQELKNHPKTIALCELLGKSLADVIGYLHLWWWWCLDYALDGDLSKYSDVQIARGAEWVGNAKRFVTALQRSGFMDDRKVHDWHEFTLHYNLSMEKKERQREQVRERVKRWRNAKVTHGNAPVTQCNAPTVPNQTKPTIPNQPTAKAVARFQEPSAQDVKDYGVTIGYRIDAQAFVDHYESNGWKVGKNPMKDWRAAVRNWRRHHAEFGGNGHAPAYIPPPKPMKPEPELSDSDAKAGAEFFGNLKATLRAKEIPK